MPYRKKPLPGATMLKLIISLILLFLPAHSQQKQENPFRNNRIIIDGKTYIANCRMLRHYLNQIDPTNINKPKVIEDAITLYLQKQQNEVATSLLEHFRKTGFDM
jgi:hypothetical protein